MAISIVASTTFRIPTGASSTNVTLPGTPLQDDIVVVSMASDNAANAASVTTSGYTTIFETLSSAPGGSAVWKRMGGTPDTIVTISQQASASREGGIYLIRGVDTTTATAHTGSAPTASGTTGMPNAPSITTLVNDALVIAFGCLDDDVVSGSVTVPSGYGDLLVKDTASGGGLDATFMMAAKIVSTAGAEDPAAFGGSGTDDWFAASFSLRPAAGGAITGALTATLADATATSTATLAIAGASSPTLAAATLSATGTLSIAGALTVTLDDATVSAAGSLALTGAAGSTLDGLTLSSAGLLAAGPSGSLTVTLGPLTAAGVGSLAIKGSAAASFGDLTLSAAGSLALPGLSGALTASMASLMATAAGSLRLTGSAEATLGDLTLYAGGALTLGGALASTLEPLTSDATGALSLSGTASATLGDLTAAATGRIGSITPAPAARRLIVVAQTRSAVALATSSRRVSAASEARTASAQYQDRMAG